MYYTFFFFYLFQFVVFTKHSAGYDLKTNRKAFSLWFSIHLRLCILQFTSFEIIVISQKNSFLWCRPLNLGNNQSFCHGNLMTHLYPRGELKYRNTIQEREKGQQNSTAGERRTGRERRIMCSGNEGTINTQTHTHTHSCKRHQWVPLWAW